MEYIPNGKCSHWMHAEISGRRWNYFRCLPTPQCVRFRTRRVTLNVEKVKLVEKWQKSKLREAGCIKDLIYMRGSWIPRGLVCLGRFSMPLSLLILLTDAAVAKNSLYSPLVYMALSNDGVIIYSKHISCQFRSRIQHWFNCTVFFCH